MANLSGNQVVELLEQLKDKRNEVARKCDDDAEKVMSLERNLVRYTGGLADIETVLAKQSKLLKLYQAQMDEAENAVNMLARGVQKFTGAFGRIAKSDQVPEGI